MVKKILKSNWPLWVSLGLAAGLKIWLIAVEAVPFNGDEAVVALMARHINQGARPVFFYGQAYMGSLDAWLLAGAFRVFGEGVLAIRVTQSVLFLLYLTTLWFMGCRWFTDRRVAGVAVMLAAVPTVLATTYSTLTLGGYGEIVLLGSLILWLGYEVTYGKHIQTGWVWLGLGLAGGLAFWTLGLAGVYLLPVGLIGLRKFNRGLIPKYLLAGLGFFFASSPWWIYNFTHQGEAVSVLFTSNMPASNLVERLVGMFALGLTSFLGWRAPWSADFAPALMLLLWLMIYLAALMYLIRNRNVESLKFAPGVQPLMLTFVLVFLGAVSLSQFGIDPTGRYYLPMYLPLYFVLAIFITAAWRRRNIYGFGLMAVLILFNGALTWKAAVSPDKLTTQFDPISRFDNSHDAALMSFLEEHGETRGYTNPWVGYRLAFLSQERLIFVAKLPYKADLSYTPLDNRIPAYDQAVAASQQVAFITTKHPQLDDLIRQGLRDEGITFSETQIGEFHIFYELSEAITPEDLSIID